MNHAILAILTSDLRNFPKAENNFFDYQVVFAFLWCQSVGPFAHAQAGRGCQRPCQRE